MTAVVKKRVTVSLEHTLWKQWLRFCIAKYGNTHHASEELEKAMKDWLKKHNNKEE